MVTLTLTLTPTPTPTPTPNPNPEQVSECGCVHQALTEEYRNRYEVGDELRMICEPAWGRDGDAMNCIQHQENAVGLEP